MRIFKKALLIALSLSIVCSKNLEASAETHMHSGSCCTNGMYDYNDYHKDCNHCGAAINKSRSTYYHNYSKHCPACGVNRTACYYNNYCSGGHGVTSLITIIRDHSQIYGSTCNYSYMDDGFADNHTIRTEILDYCIQGCKYLNGNEYTVSIYDYDYTNTTVCNKVVTNLSPSR